eukprot:jgi/Ulvmu1/11080/UM007_0262.1
MFRDGGLDVSMMPHADDNKHNSMPFAFRPVIFQTTNESPSLVGEACLPSSGVAAIHCPCLMASIAVHAAVHAVCMVVGRGVAFLEVAFLEVRLFAHCCLHCNIQVRHRTRSMAARRSSQSPGKDTVKLIHTKPRDDCQHTHK